MQAGRYVRQEKVLGQKGQDKLAKSSVCIVGCGGLGCPISLYITSSGVGSITVIDDDTVSLSNLHRQILFNEHDIGLSKVRVASEKLQKINSSASIIPVYARLNERNIEEYIQNHDLIIVGCDNLPTRYIINDACCKLNIPFINASVQGDEGSLAFFDIQHGCYRCVFPETPPADILLSSEDAGVLGAMVGVIGTVAATMAIEILTGNKKSYINKIFRFDSLTLRIKTFPFAQDELCQSC